MGYEQRNMFPEARKCAPELGGTDATIQSFDGVKAIQGHLDHVARLKDYLCARTKEIPDLPLACYSECQVAQWMHSEHVKECANKKLIESACKCCEEFHGIAAQSVLLTKRDMPEPASEIIQSALDFETASCRFQQALAELHVECKLNQ
jgi:hypothetical protein